MELIVNEFTPERVLEYIVQGCALTLASQYDYGFTDPDTGVVYACVLGAGRYAKFGVDEEGIVASYPSQEYWNAETDLDSMYIQKYGHGMASDNDTKGRDVALSRLKALFTEG